MDSINSFQDLKSFCEDNFSLKKKLGFIIYQPKQTPCYLDKFIMIIEYFQLLSQIFLVFPETITSFDDNDENQYLFKIIFAFFKIFNPSHLLTYSKSNNLAFNISILLFIFTIFRFAYISSIVFQAAFSKKHDLSPLTKTLWKWIYKLQSRVICFFITSFWIEAIIGFSKQDFTFFGSSKPGNIAFFSVLIAIEYIFSFIIETQFCYLLPTKNFLSNKSFDLQLITLTQKLILQVLYTIFEVDSSTFIWVFSCFSVLLCCIRSQYFYRTLPLYNYKAILYQGDLISLVNTASVARLMQALLQSSEYMEFNQNFYVITWIVLSILLVRISRGYLQNLIITLLTTEEQRNLRPELQIHKIYMIKQYQRELIIPQTYNHNYDLKYLISNSINTTLKNNDFTNSMQQSEENLHKVFLQTLEDLQNKFPDSTFVKLHLAYLCSKKADLYAKGIKALSGTDQTTWSKYYLTASFMYRRIEKAIMVTSKNQSKNNKLDLFDYVKSVIYIEELKNDMLKQTQLTIKICKDVLQEVSEIGRIFDHAQEIHHYRTRIQKKFMNLTTSIPEYFIEPFRLCAEYHLALNFSALEYERFLELFSNKYSKHEKHFKNLSLTHENLYQSTNAFLLISGGQKFDNGQILYSTKSIEDLCGTTKNSLYKAHVSSLFPPHLQTFFTEMIKQICESGKIDLLNKTATTYIYHKNNGYITEANIFLRFHPYITEDLYLNLLIRPVINLEECLLLRENGDIEGATKLISMKLSLNSHNRGKSLSSLNIKAISEELFMLNEAVNLLSSTGDIKITDKIGESVEIIDHDPTNLELRLSSPTRQRKHHGLSYDQSLQLYNTFSTSGNEIPILINKTPVSFHCRISLIQFGSIILKRLHLTPSSKYNDDDDDIYYEEVISSPTLHKDEHFSVLNSENIDCEEIKQGEEFFTEWKGDGPLSTYHNLLTPKSQGDLPLITSATPKQQTSRRRLLTMATNNLPMMMSSSEILISEQHEQFNEPVKNFQRSKTLKQELVESDPYQERIEQNTYTTFNRALTTKSYPKKFNVLSGIYIFLVVFIVCSQIILKIISDQTTENLQVKKEMLNSAQQRTFYVFKVQADSRGIITIISGAATPGEAGATELDIPQLLNLTKWNLDSIIEADKNIRANLNSLDDQLKQQLFYRDVRIYGSYNDPANTEFQNVTTFQAIDIVQTALSKAYALKTIVSPAGYQIFHFIVMNTLNDIVSKNNEINSRFIKSVNIEKDELETIIVLVTIIAPLLLLMIYIVLAYIIWTQYSLKKTNMLAFVKLHPNRVKSLMISLTKFADLLSDKELGAPVTNKRKLTHMSTQFNSQNQPNALTYHKNHIIKAVNYTQIKKRYYKYTILITIYILSLFLIIIGNFISASHSINLIYKKQQQLQFANELSVGCLLGYISMVELFVSNNTNHVQHLFPKDSLKKTLLQIDEYQDEVNTIFMDSDGDYDPEVYSLLFKPNVCSVFKDFRYYYCSNLLKMGQSASLVQSLSLLRASLSDKLSAYDASNKTSIPSIIAVGLINYQVILSSSNLVASKAQLISQIIDAQLVHSIEEANCQRSIILTIFIIGMVIAVTLIWYQVLVKVREVNNDFKKVLKTFPPNFILSSFLLKTFLRENSQGVFDL